MASNLIRRGQMNSLPDLGNLTDCKGFNEFSDLWTNWKKGRNAVSPKLSELKACAVAVLHFGNAEVAAPVNAVDFLNAVRPLAINALVAHLGVQPAETVRLWRGIRHSDAEQARAALDAGTPFNAPKDDLLSYSMSQGAAVGFARKKNRSLKEKQFDGLVYWLDVASEEIVMIENPQLCPNYLGEEEVLVFHSRSQSIHMANVSDVRVSVAPM